MTDKWPLVRDGVRFDVDGQQATTTRPQRLTASKANVTVKIIGGEDPYVMPAGFVQSHLELTELRRVQAEALSILQRAVESYYELESLVYEAIETLGGKL